MRILTILIALVCLTTSVSGQAQCSLTTFYNGLVINSQPPVAGNMFDIVAGPADVTISRFDVNLLTGFQTVEVWYLTAGGSYVGNENNQGLWTQAGSVNVVAQGFNNPTQLFLDINVVIPATMTQAFYVTCANGDNLIHTPGTFPQAASASNADLSVLEGSSNAYPFGAVTGGGPIGGILTHRWNGTVHYTVTGGATPEYQTNSFGAALDVDSVYGDCQNVAQVTLSGLACGGLVPATGELTLASGNLGQFFEIAISGTTTAPKSAMSPVLLGLFPPNIINLPFLPVTFPYSFANGLTVPSLQPMPGGAFPGSTGSILTVPLSFGASTGFSLQGLITDPGEPSGINFSQAVEVTVAIQTQVPNLPLNLNDDEVQVLDLISNCWDPVVLYGTSYTQMGVSSNGNVQFPTGTIAPTNACCNEPQVMATGLPSIGAPWADFNPLESTAPATIEVVAVGIPTSAGGAGLSSLEVKWTGLAWFGPELDPVTGATITSTFSILFTASSPGILDQVTINLTSIGDDPDVAQAEDNWLGITPGLVGGATYPGLSPATPLVPGTPFDPVAGLVAAPNATDMIYEYLAPGVGPQFLSIGSAAQPGNGTTSIIFTPSAVFPPNYDHIAF